MEYHYNLGLYLISEFSHLKDIQLVPVPGVDLLHLIENVFTLILALTPITNHNSNPNPKAQWCFRTDKMASFFDQVYTGVNSIQFSDCMYLAVDTQNLHAFNYGEQEMMMSENIDMQLDWAL